MDVVVSAENLLLMLSLAQSSLSGIGLVVYNLTSFVVSEWYQLQSLRGSFDYKLERFIMGDCLLAAAYSAV